MPKSKSKRRKVLNGEKNDRRREQVANAGFNRDVRGDNRMVAAMNGFECVDLADIPADHRAEFEAMLRDMGRGARIYRKPDGSFCIMA